MKAPGSKMGPKIGVKNPIKASKSPKMRKRKGVKKTNTKKVKNVVQVKHDTLFFGPLNTTSLLVYWF